MFLDQLLRLNFYLFFVVVLLAEIAVCGNSVAEAQAPEPNWSQKMQETSRVLIDGFPFLYSKREFSDPDNKMQIKNYIEGLKKGSHTLPTETGKKFIGADPLIDHFNKQIPQVLDKSIKSLLANDYELSQKQVKMAVHKCVACHTAYQMGPQEGKANDEIVGIPLDPLSKFEVSVALRQFNSALNILEKEIESATKKMDLNLLRNYLRMHLLVSIRSLQDFERAKNALSLYNKTLMRLGHAEDKGVKKWEKDVEEWLLLKGSPKEKMKFLSTQLARERASQTSRSISQQDSYVHHLLMTFLLHQSLLAKTDGKGLQHIYAQLANHYQALDLPILADLSAIYRKKK